MRRTSILLLAVGISLLLAAPASAALPDRLASDLADDGALNACKYSKGELGQLKDLIGNDIDAYSPDFRTAIDAVIEQRAQGACSKAKQPGDSGGTGGGSGSAAGPGATGGSSGTNSPGPGGAASAPGEAQLAPAPDQAPSPSPLIGTDAIAAAARSGDDGGAPPLPLLAIAVLAALLALGGLLLGAARWTGWEPAWADRARHSAAEAGWRVSATWTEFTDFARFGR